MTIPTKAANTANTMKMDKMLDKTLLIFVSLISNHLIAIWHGLQIIGTMIDVDIQVPDHSIFYALMTYKGKNKTITRVREYIDRRPAKVSVSLRDFNEEEEV